MHFSTILAATVGAFASTTFAAPAVDPDAASSVALPDTTPNIVTPPGMEKREECKTYARTEKDWTENALTRRRVHFAVLGKDGAGKNMKKWGKMWNDGKEKCSAITNNVQVYTIKDGGERWVIDSNEVLGPAGDNAHGCLLGRFQRKLASKTDCKDDGDGRD